MNVRPYGDSAILFEPGDAAAVLPLAQACRSIAGVREVVPAARTVLVVLDGAGAASRVTEIVTGLELHPDPVAASGSEVVLDVVYDGPDLAATADALGLDVDGLVRAHSSADYRVGFCGFVPGFAYLVGLPVALHAPRLDSPRARVPAGSVGIAGEFTGVYPRESPGGWRLLARTDAVLFDPRRTPPALLTPGTRVRFHPLRGT